MIFASQVPAAASKTSYTFTMPRAKNRPGQCKAGIQDDPELTCRCAKKAIDGAGYCAEHRDFLVLKQRATKHNIYSKFMTKAEIMAIYGNEDANADLVSEITMAKVIVQRAFTSWNEFAADDERVDLEEITEKQVNGDIMKLIKSKRPDLYAIIDRGLARVGRLMEQQAKVHEVDRLTKELEELRARLPQLTKS